MSAVMKPVPSAIANNLPATGDSAMADQAAQEAAVEAERQRWCALVSQIGAEIAMPLSDALERVTAMTATGQIDVAGLRALRSEIDGARSAGMLCQQVARLASGRVRQSHERVHLTNTLQSVLGHRSREMQARGVQIRQTLQAVEVIVDASLLFSLLNTVLDWAMSVAQGPIDLRIDTKTWPVHGQLHGRFAWRAPDRAQGDAAPVLDTLLWRLIEASTRVLGVTYERKVEGHLVEITIEFPRTVNALIDLEADLVPSEAEQESVYSSSVNSKPLAGQQVLVVAARRDVRVQVREALRDMGLTVDFVSSVDEAAEFCRDGLPHAVVVDSAHNGARFSQLMRTLRADAPGIVFIEIGEDGADVRISTLDREGCARVGREAIMSSLASAVVYELTRNL